VFLQKMQLLAAHFQIVKNNSGNMCIGPLQLAKITKRKEQSVKFRDECLLLGIRLPG
jgi:hypothetical protein